MPIAFHGAAPLIVAAVLVPFVIPQAQPSAPPARATVTHSTSAARVEGRPIETFTLTNTRGIEMQVMSYGGIITSLKVPDRDGRMADVVLGFDSPQRYLDQPPPPYFGALIG